MASQQVVVRLPPTWAQALDRAVRATGRSRSQIVRDALGVALGVTQRLDAPADRVSGLIGSLQSGVPDLATNTRRHVLESLRRARRAAPR